MRRNVSEKCQEILHRFLYEICGDCCKGRVDDERYEEHERGEARNRHNRQGEGCVELQLCLSMVFAFRCDLDYMQYFIR